MNEYLIKRNSNGWVIENCPINIGVRIGGFDCTCNCPHNENTKKEIHEKSFELEYVRCSKISQEQQLKIQI